MKRPDHFTVLVIGVLIACVGALIDFLPLGFLGLIFVAVSVKMLDTELRQRRYGLGPKR